jgi:hypothetical protein
MVGSPTRLIRLHPGGRPSSAHPSSPATPGLGQSGQLRGVGWMAVRVDARRLHPAVPGVAVQVVGEHRYTGEGRDPPRERP